MNDSEFDDMLKTARGSVPLPDSFRHQVWRRIESDSCRTTGWQRLTTAILRPWTAATGVAAVIAAGIWLGATSGPAPQDAKIAYIESVSPFIQARGK